MEKRVVVTGMGVVSPLGNDVGTFWRNLVDGVNGIVRLTDFPTDELPAKVGGTVKGFNPEDFGIEKQFVRKQDMFTVYAVAAAVQAVGESGLESGVNIDPFRFGVYAGTGIGGFKTTVSENEKFFRDGPRWVSPNYVPQMIPNMGAGQIAIRFRCQGPCVCNAAACASSSISVGEAYRAIRHGYADAVIAGGSEAAMTPVCIASFGNARALSRSEDPEYASLPFNANRGGFVLGEGAAMLVLEEYEHAVSRGARIIAEVCGYGNSCDAYHATAPSPDGIPQAEAMRQALSEAGYRPDDVLHINAHGTGTGLNDPCETRAFKLALGEEAARRAHICSTKSMTGHLLGAAGALEAVAAVLALSNGIVPPTINLDAPDPSCDLDYTPMKAVKAPLTIAISDSLGFGGHNSCLAFRLAK